MFEKMMLRGIYGPEKEKVFEEWRKLSNADLQNLFRQILTKRQAA
jgi:hypothetical protein